MQCSGMDNGVEGFEAQSSGRSWLSRAHGARLVTPSLQYLARSAVRDMMPHETIVAVLGQVGSAGHDAT